MKIATFLKKSWIVILVIVVFMIGFFVFWRGNKTTQEETDQRSEGASGLQIEADQLSGLNIKFPGGEKNGYWLLKFAKFTDLGKAGALDTIVGEYYRDSRPVYRLTASSGTVYWQSQRLKFDNPVVVSVDQTKQISAEEMLWTPKTQNLSAKGQVEVRISDLTVLTEELTSDLMLDRIVFKGTTSATSK